ncbi:CPBP family intramembrane glutamic endopeptidase [Staphylococcus canis]|uniref:CPBP family intramembrane metalloprotease n=1 Tax=Staphylococcus canis TaxID=2724942 RepID=A0ABS0TCY7_9STAP|nr:CPBP family intramembrane glutamic endopeptidase [Staphylococcus canis]MBI5975831.1 CPBP family intramembrane metalloprotease [Staphylococcus canis]
MSHYRWKDIAWRDLWLIPILAVSLIALNMVATFVYFIIVQPDSFSNTTQLILSDGYIIATTIASVISYIIVIASFWLLHFRTMPKRFKQGIEGVKTYWKWILIAYIATMLLSQIYEWLKSFLPSDFQYGTPQNEVLVEEMIHNLSWLPLNFAFIVILAPIVEEIFFRHLLIGELGKKLNFKIMGIISVIAFAGVHVLDASSPFEIIDYLIIAIPVVWLYLKSHRNLGVTIGFHILNNFVAFILGLIF